MGQRDSNQISDPPHPLAALATSPQRGEVNVVSHLHKFAAATPTCTMRGLSTPATPTYLKTWLSISRLRAS